MSLKYLVQGMIEHGHQVAVALVEPNPQIHDLYASCGAVVFNTPAVPLFRHTTAGWAHALTPRACLYQLRALSKYGKGRAALLRIIDEYRPDIVHLNSVTLAMSASALRSAGVPVIWHVREAPVPGYLGMRYRLLRHALLHWADDVIFLSASDRRSWVGDRRGVVIPNVIPGGKQPTAESVHAARRRFGLAADDRAVAYLGGCSEIKGIFTLIAATRSLVGDFPNLRIVAPGMAVTPPQTKLSKLARIVLPAIGLSRDFESASRLIASEELRHVFRVSPFCQDVRPILAACEFVVFPSSRPHFARPVVEAASVGRASIGSDLAGVLDVIEPEVTGLLVPASDSASLAAAMRRLLADPHFCSRLGVHALQQSDTRFDAATQLSNILDVYANVRRSRAATRHDKVSSCTL
jgi:glycosyltransferase involved in cell wall biosynthesis